VYRLVEDLIINTLRLTDSNKGITVIGFSSQVADSLAELKEFNYKNIYMNPKIKKGFDKISRCYEVLFSHYLNDVVGREMNSPIFVEFLGSMEPLYLDANEPAAMVRDFIAGMTDDYFLRQASVCGCEVPERL
jgi:dGTPase